ncbi:DUF927 domain-containing protein [Burkholderia sp. PR2]|uniref:DUF927 domain-containing protein n=1 Tax=Burkholderia sp. PR2 TaxID=3448078 RepID=UPI00402A78EB
MKPNASRAAPAGFVVNARGVWRDSKDGPAAYVCGPLHVRARARDQDGEWGKLLEWHDHDGVLQRWVAPDSVIVSGGPDLRQGLVSRGLPAAPGDASKRNLAEYVAGAEPAERARLVSRTGWHGGAYVTADEVIGESENTLIYQGTGAGHRGQAGTIAGWRGCVARYCVGNPIMTLAVSSPFAAIVQRASGLESGGFNLVGNSSCGKTTALRAAVSVMGAPDGLRRWRSTANGQEGSAEAHNDSLLVLDELGQVSPHEAGDIAYMLANGTGKQRAARDGSAREPRTWRLLFLSSGEIGLAQHMMAAGKRARAGQEIRLVDVQAAREHGIFDELHGYAGGAELSTAIVDGAARNYGVAGRQFIEWASRNLDTISERLKREIDAFVLAHVPSGADGQVVRVCRRFALVGVAGELAGEAGITGWAPGESLGAAAECFRIWVADRGGVGSGETAAILRQVRAFFEAHGESRFSDLDAVDTRPTINRAGYRKRVPTREGEAASWTQYLVLPSAFEQDLCDGYSPKSVKAALLAAGWIEPGEGGRAKRQRIPGVGQCRVYVFTDAMWGGE